MAKSPLNKYLVLKLDSCEPLEIEEALMNLDLDYEVLAIYGDTSSERDSGLVRTTTKTVIVAKRRRNV